jgi:hypothetical protein
MDNVIGAGAQNVVDLRDFGYVLPVEDNVITVMTSQTRYRLLFPTKHRIQPTTSTHPHNEHPKSLCWLRGDGSCEGLLKRRRIAR